MPAIELGRLQQQVAQLSDLFPRPSDYLRGVEDLLKSHGAPRHRQGRVKGVRPVLVSYEVPPPLLRLLTQEMNTQARRYPAEALLIADGLWSRLTLETRQLAIRLLGSIPGAMSPDEITSRLEAWAHENREQLLVPELAESGTQMLRINHQKELLKVAAKMVRSSDWRKQVFAIGSLQNLVNERQLAELPNIFDMLIDPCKDPDRKIRPELANLLTSLAQFSPMETEYFLQQTTSAEATEGAHWLARQAARALPEESRSRLRRVLR